MATKLANTVFTVGFGYQVLSVVSEALHHPDISNTQLLAVGIVTMAVGVGIAGVQKLLRKD
jgi:formate hydrogenlyase subunit 3/multisubunit Na+/H+ antiporter MnhD subunit